jgi:RNA polymerase sigma-70 factor, ECF subfamily
MILKNPSPVDEIGTPGEGAACDLPDFAAVVEAHWTAVFRLLYCMTGDVHDTEELTQETFLRALSRLVSFRPGTKMRAWLLRIARNACLDAQRKRKRARRVEFQDEPGTDRHPGYWIETEEQAALLRTAMEELSETARTVFHLRAQESLSFKEIASLLETTEEAARWHMHQARTKLLKRINGNGVKG